MTEPAPLAEAADAVAPEGGEAFWFEAADGARLRGAVWRPPGTARGTVVLLHGRTEFIEKYYEVIGELLGRGLAVASMDWRGQGLSVRETENPLKGHIDDFGAFLDDLAEFLRCLAKRALPEPWIGLAHSMGGNVVLRWLACQGQGAAPAAGLPKLRAAALAAPMIGLKLTGPVYLAMRMLCFAADAVGLGGRYLPGGSNAQATGRERFEANIVTSDPRRYARLEALVTADPRLALASPTCGWGAAAAESMDAVGAPGVPEAIDVPVLIAGAGKDMVADTRLMPDYAQRLPYGRYLACPDARHEILMERDDIRAAFWRAFDALIDEVAPRPPARDASDSA